MWLFNTGGLKHRPEVPVAPQPGSHQHPLLLTLGPRPHLRGYVSLSMITLLIFATTPWSQVEMTAVVIKAIAAEASRELVNTLEQQDCERTDAATCWVQPALPLAAQRGGKYPNNAISSRNLTGHKS